MGFPETKICRRCGEEKPLEEFLDGFNTIDLHQDWCMDCLNERYDGDWFQTYKGRKWEMEHFDK